MLDVRCQMYQRTDNPEGPEGWEDKPDSIRRNGQTKLCADAQRTQQIND